ncbi:cysteine--1-D-myo-inosityl 2-amino-2-deoxy-alpha-D-glucopyranoside ligase [Arthrobacter mobilis]|uniref:L-cysteine:1D-myo-inositol 2-amino-2-deoxy-alpha-D-glucopyranoside ligase n=1 Tax=Arthrobacter mobilis TaxID=2724944 RepID=A0A7X6HE17_9MICC|nr:cysteine--1-D-myo-inosityl 2-amino-2-deoxy-alpha-D-glucopyranoside ligase [Arthrobacter mobilis]NKX53942.1 cysteine--1-D-myo-inosityl 2-amino-2-deoxy-alpha-D-glucopyranoside ligase [Arthrobacter mobilis]
MLGWNAPVVPEVPGGSDDLSLYDTAAGALARIEPSRTGSLYVCGITPYDATHMGHAATYVSFDLLNRYWRDAGRTVQYVQNVTDIDDPLLERANATGVDWEQLAKDQTELFRADMEALNVLPPDEYVGAVESIAWIIPAVEQLIAEGLAYRVPGTGGEPDGDVYFDTAAAAGSGWEVGRTCRLTEAQMLPLFAERGGDPDRPGKRHRLDPLLWRVARDGEPNWPGGSLGDGRPGWHIECSVIARKFLPETFDVQGGGSDLSFPHHEMSAGHAYALTKTPLARHFVHAGMVGLDGEKMSKSKGNLVLVSRLRESGVEPAAIRTVLLGQHYRSDWFWTDGLLEDGQARLAAWRRAAPLAAAADVPALAEAIRRALSDNLNAPAALAAVDAFTAAQQAAGGGPGQGTGTQAFADVLDALLGIRL